MQGNIDFTGSLSGSIAGGGGGGSDVTITPTLATGTKIADYTIDSESGSLYAPTPEGLTAELPLEISNNVISIDLSDYVTETDLNTVLDDYTTYTYTESRYTPLATFNAYTLAAENHFQRVLTAGANITIDPVTDTISASGGSSWDYSTSEVNTGQKWIDGKDIYCKVITENVVAGDNSIVISGASEILPMTMFTGLQTNGTQIMMGYIYNLSDDYIRGYFSGDTLHIEMGSSAVIYYPKVRIIAYYTKSV